MTTIYIQDCGIVCALGASREEVKERMYAADPGAVAPAVEWSRGRELPLGAVCSELPALERLPLRERSRNNQLTLAALAQLRSAVDAAIDRFGAGRVGVVLGTSTSGIASAEQALARHQAEGAFPPDFHYAQQEMVSPAAMLARELGVSGPAYVHSSACSSAAKAMASAARLIRMGVCDAVLTGGVDSLCEFTVAGFSALESVSAVRCNPLSANRKGINIGEGAALFLLSATPAPVALLGWGEASDGHHISAPDPEGHGARLAVCAALERAGVDPAQVDYINLHGTATVQNDAMESRVVHALFGDTVHVSSTKPLTGHTLGAAAAIEAALCWLAMQDDSGRLPPQLWDGEPDPSLPVLRVAGQGSALGRPIRVALSNSFAFGGSNAALVLGRA